MNKAQEVKEQIYTYYGENIYYVNKIDIANKLTDNKIGNVGSEDTKYKHRGFDHERELFVIYYEDGSVLVVSSSGIIPSKA